MRVHVGTRVLRQLLFDSSTREEQVEVLIGLSQVRRGSNWRQLLGYEIIL
jgi:hypothetical protein